MPACSRPALRRTSMRLPGGVCNRSTDTGLKYPHLNNSTTASADYSDARARTGRASRRHADCAAKRKRPEQNSGFLVPRCATVLLTELLPRRQ